MRDDRAAGMKSIQIKCEGRDLLLYDELVPFQGNLKDLSKENYAKLKKEIIELGFSEPISVWKNDGNKILNGHQRLRVIKQMVEKEGYACPPLPVNYIQAKDKKEAMRKVLALTSQYGELKLEGLEEVMAIAEIEWPQVEECYRFPELDHDLKKLLHPQEETEDDDEPQSQHAPKMVECPECGERFQA